jgi:hypothetical protein
MTAQAGASLRRRRARGLAAKTCVDPAQPTCTRRSPFRRIRWSGYNCRGSWFKRELSSGIPDAQRDYAQLIQAKIFWQIGAQLAAVTERSQIIVQGRLHQNAQRVASCRCLPCTMKRAETERCHLVSLLRCESMRAIQKSQSISGRAIDDEYAHRQSIRIFRERSVHCRIRRSLYRRWNGDWIPSSPW